MVEPRSANQVPSTAAVCPVTMGATTYLGALGQHAAHRPSTRSDLSCIGLVTTLGEVVEDGLGGVGDAWRGGDLLAAEADGR